MANLRDEIARLKKQTKDFQETQAKNIYRSERNKRDIVSINKFLLQLSVVFWWLYDNIVLPLRRISLFVFRYLFKQYRRLWSYTTYKRNPFGELYFSKQRGAFMVVATFVFFFFLLGPITYLLAEGTLYVTTAKVNETVYLLNSQEVDSSTNIHNVEGCYHRLPCEDRETLYFRVESSLFNNVWSIVSRGQLFYPEQIASAIPTQESRCTVTTYGFRARWFLLRIFEVYPTILSSSCTPLRGIADK